MITELFTALVDPIQERKVNFNSSLIFKLCTLKGIRLLRVSLQIYVNTTPYYTTIGAGSKFTPLLSISH